MSSVDKKFDYLKIAYVDIQTATNNFAYGNFITESNGKSIYKGQLSRSGKLIDIVALRFKPWSWRGNDGFTKEITTLSSLQHRNLASIVGFCDENDEKIIITKFETNGSLAQHLSDPVTLTWTQRLHICLGIARALGYIHYNKEHNLSVIHGNVKSSKILLDDNWEPKLFGFELSKMQVVALRQGLVYGQLVSGTGAYVDPAYVRSGGVSHKSDVYSLGVVLFEVLCGRKAYVPLSKSTDQEAREVPTVSFDEGLGISWRDTVHPLAGKEKLSWFDYMSTMKSLKHLHISEKVLLAKLAKSHYENETLDNIIHPNLRKQMDPQSLKLFSEAAYHCLNNEPAQRPYIDQVFFALKQALEHQVANKKPVEGTSTNKRKLKHFEHLKIGLDVIESAKKYFIAKGGYGSVYKAELDSTAIPLYKTERPKRSITVAIKDIIYRDDKQGEQGFFTEIEILSSCKHPNIVPLLGFCYEPPRMILVFEHISNGSLEDYLGREAKMIILTWVQRLKICIDIARGLEYIHSTMDNKRKIIHRDVKSANILLGRNWEAKIADFGLSIFHPLNHTKSTINATKIAGTDTYLDPEYENTGKLKKESDVYSFGVVLFEILTGTCAYEWITKDNERGLAPIVRQHIESKEPLQEMVDHKLKEEIDRKTLTPKNGPNKDSLRIFSNIGYQCLSEKQEQRPTMKVVIKELEEALKSQETQGDDLQISFEDIKTATQNFNPKNIIRKGGLATLYRGELWRDNECTPIVAKLNNMCFGLGEQKFQRELDILFRYKHENIISLLGYCKEENAQISVFEYNSNECLDRHLKDASLTWMKRLKIGIDVAKALDFLHVGGSTGPSVIHRDINSAHIQLDGEWKAKITDFGLSVHAVDDVRDIPRYVGPQYAQTHVLTREDDIYSLGVVLFEMMCGRHEDLVRLVKRYYEEGKLDELVFDDIKDKIMPESLTTYKNIAYNCLHNQTEKRPKASEVVLQLKKALEFQEDIEIWEAKLPVDFKEIVQMSKTPEIYSNVSKKFLCEIFSKGILLQKGKVCFSVNNNGERNEMVSATMFSYENNILHNKRISIQNSRFQRVVKMMDISNLKIQIKIKTQFITPDVIYGAYLVFKFCDPRKFSSELMYVNLKYKMQSKSLHAYFSTRGNNEWMMIELCRFIPHKKDVDFEVLLESLSQYYCGSGAIYVEGIHFQAINDSTSNVKPEAGEKVKGEERVLKSNSDSVQVSAGYDEITQLEDNEKIFSLSKVNGKKCHMLPAKMVLYDNSDVKRFNWKSLVESRFQEAAELLSHQAFQIQCRIEAQKLSADTDYACYLVFKLSEHCHGLHCPVRVRDLLLWKNKEFKFIYFRSPRLVNSHASGRVPNHREDGLMEVIVWEFNSGNKDHVPVSLKLRCYEGTMCDLIVYGIEFQPV